MKMNFYNLCLIKAYFDKGYALTYYFKVVIYGFGLATRDLKNTIIIALIYGIFCFFLGYSWFKFRFIDAENEVNNRFNPFVKEVRKKLEIKDNNYLSKIKRG